MSWLITGSRCNFPVLQGYMDKNAPIIKSVWKFAKIVYNDGRNHPERNAIASCALTWRIWTKIQIMFCPYKLILTPTAMLTIQPETKYVALANAVQEKDERLLDLWTEATRVFCIVVLPLHYSMRPRVVIPNGRCNGSARQMIPPRTPRVNFYT